MNQIMYTNNLSISDLNINTISPQLISANILTHPLNQITYTNNLSISDININTIPQSHITAINNHNINVLI